MFEPKKKLPAPAQPPLPATKKEKPLFYKQIMKGGATRAVRIKSRSRGEVDQALSDFFGMPPELSTMANMRSMESLLSEISSNLAFTVESIAPEILNDAWREAMGDYLATQAQLVSLTKGVAVLRTAHPAVRFELTRLKRDIVMRLNKRFGEKSVRSVRIMHG